MYGDRKTAKHRLAKKRRKSIVTSVVHASERPLSWLHFYVSRQEIDAFVKNFGRLFTR